MAQRPNAAGEKRAHEALDVEAQDSYGQKREKLMSTAALSLGLLPPSSSSSSSSPTATTATSTSASTNSFLGFPFMLPNAALAAMNSLQHEELSSALTTTAPSATLEKPPSHQTSPPGAPADAPDVVALSAQQQQLQQQLQQQQFQAMAASEAQQEGKEAAGTSTASTAQKSQMQHLQHQQVQLLQQQLQAMNPTDFAAMASLVAQQMALGIMMMPAMLPLMNTNNAQGGSSGQTSATGTPTTTATAAATANALLNPSMLAALQSTAQVAPATSSEDATSTSTSGIPTTSSDRDATNASSTSFNPSLSGSSSDALNVLNTGAAGAGAGVAPAATSSPIPLFGSTFGTTTGSTEDDEALRRKQRGRMSPTARAGASSAFTSASTPPIVAATPMGLKDAEKALKQFPMLYGMPMPFLPGFSGIAASTGGVATDPTGFQLPSAPEDHGLKDHDTPSPSIPEAAALLDKNGRPRSGKTAAKKKSRGTGKPRGRPRTRPRPGEIIRRVKPPPIAPANYSMMYNYSLANLAQKSVEMNDPTAASGTSSTSMSHVTTHAGTPTSDDPRLATNALLPMEQ